MFPEARHAEVRSQTEFQIAYCVCVALALQANETKRENQAAAAFSSKQIREKAQPEMQFRSFEAAAVKVRLKWR